MKEYLEEESFATGIIRAVWRFAVSLVLKWLWQRLARLWRNRKMTKNAVPVQSDDEVLTAVEVCKLLKVSRTTLWVICRNDKSFPAAKRVSGGAPRWLKSQVLQWVAAH